MLGSILWTIVVILVILWILGLIFHVAGGLVWILLVVALIVLIYNLLTRSRTTRV
ncbi:MAG: lmo0937 family membrane protein [Ktedonobacteraceae bacterium]